MKQWLFSIIALLIVMLTVSMTACGDDDEPNSAPSQRIKVDGQNWDLSNSNPPVFEGHLGGGENESGLILTKFTKKLNPDEFLEYYDRSEDVSDIKIWIDGPEIKLDENLLDNPNIWSIRVMYSHGSSPNMDYDNPPEDFFHAIYWYLNPSRFGQTKTEYSGSIVLKKFIKDKTMTIEFNNFCLKNYNEGEGSWGPSLSKHNSIIIDGTVTYEYDEVTW